MAFYEESLRKKTTAIEKLTFKTAALQKELAKALSGDSGASSQGDLLQYIDFHQLKIENTQAAAKLAERNLEVLRLKLAMGSTASLLFALKCAWWWSGGGCGSHPLRRACTERRHPRPSSVPSGALRGLQGGRADPRDAPVARCC